MMVQSRKSANKSLRHADAGLHNTAKSARLLDMEELLTTAEVARLVGRTVATVNKWAADGDLPIAQKLPGRTGANLFRKSDVDRLLHKAAS